MHAFVATILQLHGPNTPSVSVAHTIRHSCFRHCMCLLPAHCGLLKLTTRTRVRLSATACVKQCTAWCISQPKPQSLFRTHTNRRAAVQFDGCCRAWIRSSTAAVTWPLSQACKCKTAGGLFTAKGSMPQPSELVSHMALAAFPVLHIHSYADPVAFDNSVELD